jgi:hypothetical protein
MVEVIDNFLPQDYFDNLCLMTNDLPWFFHNYSVYEWDEDPQFYHLFYYDGDIKSPEYYKYVYEVYTRYVPGVDGRGLFRMKMNGTPKGLHIHQHQYHIDVGDREHNVCILYMNTNNGYTIFEESQEKVESVANRAVLFPGHLRHTGTNCTDEGLRILMNIDYFS